MPTRTPTPVVAGSSRPCLGPPCCPVASVAPAPRASRPTSAARRTWRRRAHAAGRGSCARTSASTRTSTSTSTTATGRCARDGVAGTRRRVVAASVGTAATAPSTTTWASLLLLLVVVVVVVVGSRPLLRRTVRWVGARRRPLCAPPKADSRRVACVTLDCVPPVMKCASSLAGHTRARLRTTRATSTFVKTTMAMPLALLVVPPVPPPLLPLLPPLQLMFMFMFMWMPVSPQAACLRGLRLSWAMTLQVG